MSDTLRSKVQPALDRQANSIPPDVRFDQTALAGRANVMDFPRTSGLLSEEELTITAYSASDLVNLIARGELTSEQCTRAFVKRAGIASQLVNCCTEILAEEAIARAKKLDEYLRVEGKTVGPLHGLPMSFKEHILMEGKVVHCSYVAWIDNVAPQNGFIFDVLLECGVVPICRTPQPQAVMHLETASNIYGHTVNPYNRNCTPGGSSGGESALLALHGSPLGVGSDIGGSIRGPAGACGLYGFKPTVYRVPTGTKGLHKGRETILGTMGPLGHSLADLKLWMTSVLSREPWLREPSIVRMPWRTVAPKSTLRVAVMWSDGVVQPLPPVTRALKSVSDRLRRVEGMDVVTWHPKDHAKSWDIISSLYYATHAGEDETAMFERGGEEALPLTKFIMTQPGVKSYTPEEMDALLLERNAFRTAYARHWLAQEAAAGGEIDLILCPVSPGPAPKLGTSKYWSYTSVWNLLDYPGGVFPVTHVEASDVQRQPAAFEPRNSAEREIWESYDPKEWLGMPICLQVVARRYHDEELFAGWEAIEAALSSKKLCRS